MTTDVLILDNITKTHAPNTRSQVQALRGVNLTLKAGTVMALTAPSGAGKSTLLHIAGLLDQPSSGRVIINDVDMSNANDKARTRTRLTSVGFVYQFHHLLPELSALDNVLLPSRALGQSSDESWARHLLTSMGVGERMDHKPSALSGGRETTRRVCARSCQQAISHPGGRANGKPGSANSGTGL